MNQVVETDFAYFEFREGIIYMTYKNAVMDWKSAKEGIKVRKEISNYTNCPMYIDARDVIKVTREARDLLGSEEGSELLKATAIFIDSAFTSFLANFVINVNFKKAPLPIRIFYSEDKALDWLKTFL